MYWQPDRKAEAQAVFGTTSTVHPGVDYLLNKGHGWYVGGRVEGLQLPTHYDFRTLRLTPSDLRAEFVRLGWRQIVGFQTRNPMHRAHVELTFRAASQVEASLLIHPSVGMTRPGDVDYFTRVRCYQLLVSKYPRGTAKLALLPLAMRMGGPREAIWHAIIRKITAARISSSAAITRGQATMPMASHSTDRTKRRSCSANMKRRSASRWCPSK